MMCAFSSCTHDFAQPDNQNSLDRNGPALGEDPKSDRDYTTAGVRLIAKVYLSGPYVGRYMKTSLNKMALLPNDQPYHMAPFSYAGDEYVPSFRSNIVDWILIRLIDPKTKAIVDERAGLLTSSGRIEDLDGESWVTFQAAPGRYFVSIHHRNHVAVMSDEIIDFRYNTGTLDLTTRNSGQTEVTRGIWAMANGDVNADGKVNNTDLGLLQKAPVIFSGVYSIFDINMDGYINDTDGSQGSAFRSELQISSAEK